MLIYDDPRLQNDDSFCSDNLFGDYQSDIWALGISMMEFVYTIETGLDGHDFIENCNLAKLSDDSRCKIIEKSI